MSSLTENDPLLLLRSDLVNALGRIDTLIEQKSDMLDDIFDALHAKGYVIKPSDIRKIRDAIIGKYLGVNHAS